MDIKGSRQCTEWPRPPANMTVSTLLALCEGYPLVTSGFPSQRAGNAQLGCFPWCQLQTVEQTVELYAIWEALTLAQSHRMESMTHQSVFDLFNLFKSKKMVAITAVISVECFETLQRRDIIDCYQQSRSFWCELCLKKVWSADKCFLKSATMVFSG